MSIIGKIAFEFCPLSLGVCSALVYLKPRNARIGDLLQTSIACGILCAFSSGELVGPARIALEAIGFDCSAFLIGSISTWFISDRVHHLEGLTYVTEKEKRPSDST